jgi:hypothetical protein
MKALAFLTPSMWAALRFDPPPEPTALLLLGTALIVIGKILRRWEAQSGIPGRAVSTAAGQASCMLPVVPTNSAGRLERGDGTVVSVFDLNPYGRQDHPSESKRPSRIADSAFTEAGADLR